MWKAWRGGKVRKDEEGVMLGMRIGRHLVLAFFYKVSTRESTASTASIFDSISKWHFPRR